MSKTVKLLLFGLLAMALVAGIALFVVVSRLDHIVKAAVERTGSETLGTKVSLSGASISLRKGRGALQGLQIANPEGFTDANAFELDEIDLDLEIGSLRSDEIVIESVVVDGARILFEETGGRINLQQLIPARRPGEDPEAEALRLVIKELRFINARASLISERLDSDVSVPIPDVVLRDIGQKGAGVTAAEAGAQILRPLIQQVIEGAQGATFDELKGKAAGKIMDFLGGKRSDDQEEP